MSPEQQEDNPFSRASHLQYSNLYLKGDLEQVEEMVERAAEGCDFDYSWSPEYSAPIDHASLPRYVKEMKLSSGLLGGLVSRPKGGVRVYYWEEKDGGLETENVVFVRGDFADLINARTEMDEFLNEVDGQLDRID